MQMFSHYQKKYLAEKKARRKNYCIKIIDHSDIDRSCDIFGLDLSLCSKNILLGERSMKMNKSFDLLKIYLTIFGDKISFNVIDLLQLFIYDLNKIFHTFKSTWTYFVCGFCQNSAHIYIFSSQFPFPRYVIPQGDTVKLYYLNQYLYVRVFSGNIKGYCKVYLFLIIKSQFKFNIFSKRYFLADFWNCMIFQVKINARRAGHHIANTRSNHNNSSYSGYSSGYRAPGRSAKSLEPTASKASAAASSAGPAEFGAGIKALPGAKAKDESAVKFQRQNYL